METVRNQRSQLAYAAGLVAAGAAIALLFSGAMSERSAHAQGNSPGAGGYGSAGIPAVLMRLDQIEEALHARLDAIDEEMAEIRDTVTPRAFDATVDICFELSGGFDAAAGIGLERNWGLEGFLGIDFFGNGAQLKVPPKLVGLIPLPSGLGSQAGAQLGGSAGLGTQFCVAFPVSRLNELAPEQEDLAEAVAMAAESLRDDLVDFLGGLGLNSVNVQSKVASGRNLMTTFPSNDGHVLNMLQDGAGQLVNLLDVMPLNNALKIQVVDFTNTQAVPASVPSVDICNTGILADAPIAFMPLIQQMCVDQQDGLALRDNINTTLSRVTQIRSTANDIRDEVACLFCDAFPLWCVFNSDACND